jgi:predicted ATPase
MTSPRHAQAGRPATDPCGSFVGREQELARLRALLEQASAGRPRLVLLEGPVGIGKTALVRRVLHQARIWRVLWAEGKEPETNLPYSMLGQLFAGTTTGTTVELPSPMGIFGRASDRDVDPLEIGATLLDLLGFLQHRSPVALVVDDAHWADRPSLHALAFALRRLRVGRVVAIVVVRDLANPRLPESLRLALTAKHGHQLRLAGLSVSEWQLLASEHGVDALPAWALTRLYEHTLGNPSRIHALLDLPASDCPGHRPSPQL